MKQTSSLLTIFLRGYTMLGAPVEDFYRIYIFGGYISTKFHRREIMYIDYYPLSPSTSITSTEETTRRLVPSYCSGQVDGTLDQIPSVTKVSMSARISSRFFSDALLLFNSIRELPIVKIRKLFNALFHTNQSQNKNSIPNYFFADVVYLYGNTPQTINQLPPQLSIHKLYNPYL